MALLNILIAPDPTLKQKTKPVAAVDDDIRQLMDDMLETMYDAPGIGLAAPQVGVLKQVLVIDVARQDETPAPVRMVNPEIVWVSDTQVSNSEGCLSLPEQYADVTRPDRVKVRYLDETGARQVLEADGLLATCIQHEIDHLSGILFVDHLSALKRNMILRRMAKWKRQQAA